jgi:HK97 family phage portal protein
VTILARYREQRANIESPGVPLTSQVLVDLFSRKVRSGVSVTEETSLTIPAVKRAVDLIAGTTAGLPLKTYRNEPDGTRVEIRNTLLELPYPDVVPFVFWELVLTDALLWSNSYLYKVLDEAGTGIAKLLRIPPWEVQVDRDESTRLNPSGKRFRVGGNRFTPVEIMHIPGQGTDGIRGLSRIGLGAEALGVALAAEQTAASMFGDGLLFAGILHTDQDLNLDQAKGIAAMFREFLRGDVGAKIPVLGKGTGFDKMSMAADEAQMLETRSWQVLEVARLFGIPPPLLMDPGATSNYGTGLEQQMLFFLVTTLNGWLTRTEQIAGLHLTPRGQFCEWTRAGLLQADTAVRYEAYAKGIQFGWLSPADVRRFENLPVDDSALEEFLRPVNMAAAGGVTPSLKEKVDAVGTLVRSGFDPASALEALGLPAIDHLGLLPVTLQKEEVFEADAEAAQDQADGADDEDQADDEDDPAAADVQLEEEGATVGN